MGASPESQTLTRFREQWTRGGQPDWRLYAHEVSQRSLAEVCEVVAVDLVQRWERAASSADGAPERPEAGAPGAFPARPLLEHYLRAWPALAGAAAESLCRCLCVEYAVRLRCGDRPTPEEYRERFPELWPVLKGLLEVAEEEDGGTRSGEIPTILFHRGVARATKDAAASFLPVSGTASGSPDRDRSSLKGHSAGRPDAESVTPDQPTVTIRPSPDDTVNGPPVERSEAKLFGEYQLLEEISRGGMGVVYRARQVQADRVVALKMIRSGNLADTEEIERFRVEARAAARLDHPGIVPVFDVGEIAGQHYFTMGYVDGPTLKAFVREGPLPPRRAAEITRKIADAVAYAHAQGVIHRDLKPSNVLMDADGNPRITDFGLAKQVESDSNLTASGAVMGTPAYMPPEQAAGQVERIGPHSDVYAIGAILYELITGRPPFSAPSTLELLSAVMQAEPVAPRSINPSIDRDLETICLKCLQKDPARRYASARELVDELDRYLTGRPILARPIGTFERAWRWCRRHVVVSVLACGLVLSLVAGLAFSTYFAAAMRQRAAEAQRHYRNEQQARRAAQREQLRALLSGIEMQTRLRPQNGWSWKALEDLRRAAALDAPQRWPQMRSYALRALSALDVRPLPKIRVVLGEEVANLASTPDGLGLVIARGQEDWQCVTEVVRLASRETVERYVYDSRMANVARLLHGTSRYREMNRYTAVSHNGRWAAAVTRFGRLVIWRRNEAAPVQVFESNVPEQEGGQVRFVGDGNKLVASFWTPKLEDAARLCFFAFDEQRQQWSRAGHCAASTARFTPLPGSDAILAGDDEAIVRVSWRGNDKQRIVDRELDVAAIHPTGRAWAAAVAFMELLLFDAVADEPMLGLPDQQFLGDLGRAQTLEFVGDSFAVVASVDRAAEVRIYDFSRRGVVASVPADGRRGPPVAVSPDGSWFAVGGNRDVRPYRVRRPLMAALPPTDGYVAAGFLDDGRLYAIRTTDSETIRLSTFGESLTHGSGTLWPDRVNDRPIQLEPSGNVTGLFCLTGDGQRILAPCGDRQLVCWSASDGKRLFAFDNGLQTLLTGRTRIHRAHPVGDKLIVATNSSQIVSVDPQSGALLRILLSIDVIPLTVHALPDRERLFVGTDDGHVIVADWDGNVLSRWEHADGRIAATVASDDGRCLLVAATAGLMTLYVSDAGSWRPVL
ncbi:MAG: serine/threonine protein kinase, partial [Planctomycetota bacterium]